MLQPVCIRKRTEGKKGPLQILGEVRTLIAGMGEDNPFWSPDGSWIAYTSSGLEPSLISRNDVYVFLPMG
ncbi:MAG: hypothetical protein CM1200mP40_13860 [Gammaproteobacteria bacterium]|nr:MAG: hypothetical protein CM1200mP40_13860 [Gammaproteobacteria bacterium]